MQLSVVLFSEAALPSLVVDGACASESALKLLLAAAAD
jgi:hypothetical protein